MKWFLKALKQYADFSGRAQRSEYWFFVLFYFLFAVVVQIVDLVIFGNAPIQVLSLVLSLGLLVPSIAVTARRLHDIGKSGWWQLIIIVPIIGVFVLLYFLILDSHINENQYGSNPKNEVFDTQE